MEKIFFAVLNQSISGGFVILAILLLRLLFSKIPKLFFHLLWVVALIRLLLPISFEGIYSLIPTRAESVPIEITEMNPPQIHTGIAVLNTSVNPLLQESQAKEAPSLWDRIKMYVDDVWLLGMGVLFFYGMYSLVKWKRKIRFAKREEENLFLTEGISTPFVLGLWKPKIYLPTGLSQEEKEYILLHEKTHIRRGDPFFRFFSSIALMMHWFNPLVWLFFLLSERDMEMSCDEKVIQIMGQQIKKQYSGSLLSMATANTRRFSILPLAFGESGTKGRIQNVLRYKKPAFWGSILLFLCVILLAIGFLSNPKSKEAIFGKTYQVKEVLYTAPIYSFTYTAETAPHYRIDEEGRLYRKESEEYGFVLEEQLKQIPFSKEEFTALLTPFEEGQTFLEEKLKRVYRADVHDKGGTFYLVLETKEKGLWLAIGYEREEEALNKQVNLIRWLFQLEETTTGENALYSYRTSYVGDATKMVGILSGLQYPKGISYNGISLDTEEAPYKGTVQLLSSKEQLEKLQHGEEMPFMVESAIVFSLVKNLDQLTFSLEEEGGERFSLSYHREMIEGLCGMELWEESKTEESFGKLRDKVKEKLAQSTTQAVEVFPIPIENRQMPDFSYEGTKEELSLLYRTEVERKVFERMLSSQYHPKEDTFLVPAIKFFKKIEKEDNIKLFATIYNSEYKIDGKRVSEESGSVIPVCVTYSKEQEEYVVKEYQMAADGGNFAISIREFSVDFEGNEIPGLAEDILNHYQEYDDLIQLQRQNLVSLLEANKKQGMVLVHSYDSQEEPLTE